MSHVRWIDLPTWISLAAHQEQKWIHNIDQGLNLDGTSILVASDPSSKHNQLKLVKLAYVQRCVKVASHILNRLIRNGDWGENVDNNDAVDDADSSMVGNSSIRAQDISLQNLEVEVSCPCPEGCGSAGEDSADIHISNDGCTMNGVRIDMDHMQSILESSNKVEFIGSMKGMHLKKSSFMQSRNQYLRQLGLLFHQLFSRGKSFQSTEDKSVDAENSSMIDHGIHEKNEDLSNGASKLMKKMSLDHTNKELLDVDVPLSLCRVVNDLIHSGNGEEETSFQSLMDIINELNDIIHDRPQILFYNDAGSNSNEGRIEFGNIVYGREAEIQQIAEVVARPNELFRNSLILISGRSGEGKSYLIEGMKHDMVNASGWVHVGVKFDRLMHNSPLTAVSSAFERFFAALLSSSGQEPFIAAITQSLQLFLSPSMTLLLCNLIPSLRRLFPALLRRVISDDDLTSYAEENSEGPNQADEILSDPESSRNRLHYSMRRLVHAISSFRPLLFAFDDLQWGDPASLDLFTSLLIEWDPLLFEANVPIAHTLFVGLYRSEDVDSNHILSTKYFPLFYNTRVLDVYTIQLRPMTKEACNSMVSNALRLPLRLTRPLANLVHTKTVGSPFYIRAFVDLLATNRTLYYSVSERRWIWDLEAIKNTPITANVAHMMKRSIQTLPEITVQALKLLSCFGSKADEATLGLFSNHIDMIDALAAAVDKSIVEKHGEVYSFAHDILEQSAYELMSREEQSNNHLLIGSVLVDKAIESFHSQSKLNKFLAADQINRARMMGNSQLSYSVQYANLNLEAAEAASSVSNFSSALSYARHGLVLLADRQWQEPNYKLTLRLYETASKACFISSQSGKLRYFLDIIFEHALCFDDKFPSYLLLIETLGAMGKANEAIEHAFSILQELGDTFPEDISPSLIQNEVTSTAKALSGFTDEEIKNPPRVEDWSIQIRMQMMETVIPFLFNAKPHYIPLLACRIVKLSIEHGFCSDSAFGLFAYAYSIPDIGEAYRWGKLSLSLHERFGPTDKHPRLKCQVYGFLAFFCEPLQAVAEVLRNNHRDAVLAGDNYYAIFSIIWYVRCSMMCGHNLTKLERECISFATQMTQLNQRSMNSTYVGICAVILELAGSQTNPFTLIPSLEFRSEEDYLDRFVASGNSGNLQTWCFNALLIDFWYKKYEKAAVSAKKYRSRGQRRFADVYHSFYEGLIAFQLAKQSKSSEESNLIETGKRAITSFETWAKHSQWNFENKLRLLKAELISLTGNRDEAVEEYKASIESAREHRFVQEEGLAFELLSSLYKREGNAEQAKMQLTNARKCYEKWGLQGVIELRTPAQECSEENFGQSEGSYETH